MSQAPLQTAEGQEVLVVDADDKVLRGIERLLGEAGLMVTGTPDPARARDQVLNKFFAVALCDLDTPGPGEGVAVARFIREKSPITTVIMMTPRKAYEAAVEAFRGGASDVVLKQPDAVQYLRDRVVSAALEVKVSTERGALLEEAAQVHEEFLRRMMEMSRQVVDLEDRVLGRKEGGVELAPETLDVLVVDDDAALFARLSGKLTESGGWRVRAALTGGEALDLATQNRFHVAIVKETLPDLPGSMVLKAVKGSFPDAIALLYTPPAAFGNAGEVKMMESSRLFTLIPAFSDPDQLLASLGEVREAFQKKASERRYLLAFRQHHFDFIKRYSDLKQRIARVMQRQDLVGSSASISKPLAGVVQPKR